MNKKPIKPLNCIYCEHAYITPYVPGRRYADCDCPDVPLDLYAVWERRNLAPYVSAESWMPYHCGHFIPRMIRVKCAHKRCTKTIDTAEWYAAKHMYIGPEDELCCSPLCAEILRKEYLLAQERRK